MIMCQSRPLEPSRTVRVLLADRPPFRHSEHSERQRLWTNLKFEGRTVRTLWADRPPFTLCNPPETKSSLDKFLSDLRTIRAPGPDRPQSNLSAQARETTSLDNFFKTPADCPHPRGGPSAVRPSSPNRTAISLDKKEVYLWTIRPTGPNRPPF